MPRLMSFTKTWPQFVDGSKRVTRRSRKGKGGLWLPGWPTLKPGDMIEGIEWTPRWAPHGERWVCPDCGWLGDTDPGRTEVTREARWAKHAKVRPLCHHDHPQVPNPALEWRGPQRLPGTEGHRCIVSVREEFLSDITPEEVALEGFPDCSVGWFVDMYCSYDPDWGRPVNRIEFEELS